MLDPSSLYIYVRDNMKLTNLTLEILNKCVQNCIHCSSSSCFDSNKIIYIDQIMDIVKQAKELGLKNISISGGEPFLHPQLLEILEYLRNEDFNISLYTCGIIGTPDNPIPISEKQLKAVKNINNKIVFSLHGMDDICNNITGIQNSFQMIINSIRNSINIGMIPEIHFVPMTNNYSQLEDVVRYTYELGIRKISILHLVTQGRCENNDKLALLNPDNINIIKLSKRLENELDGLSIRKGTPWNCYTYDANNHPCTAGVDKLVISSNGQVVPCEAFKFLLNHDDIPNIFNTTLENIWKTDKLLFELRIRHQIMSVIQEERAWFGIDNI